MSGERERERETYTKNKIYLLPFSKHECHSGKCIKTDSNFILRQKLATKDTFIICDTLLPIVYDDHV